MHPGEGIGPSFSTVSLFFGFLIGKSKINVHAVARAYVNLAITPGTITVTDGITSTIPGTETVIGGTTTTIGGTETVIGGTTVTTPATTVVTPAVTTVTGGTTITNPDVTTTTTIPPKAALLFAKSQTCNVALKLGGANSKFGGAVVTNGGVQVNSNDIQGDEMVWGHGINPSSCVSTKPNEWKGIIREAPQIYDWFAPIPICTPATACKTSGPAVLATAISDGTDTRPCLPFSTFSSATPGVYCSTSAITLPNGNLLAAGGFGFVAPSITIGGDTYRGYTQLYSGYGGFFLYAYGPGGIKSAGNGTGFKGAIFAPLGDVSMSGRAARRYAIPA